MRARGLAGLAVVAGLALGLWALVVRGSLTLDLGVGRRYRPLGPIAISIAAAREVVFDVISEPYLGRTPRSLAKKLEVLERGEDVVLAAHHTPAYGLTATTVETVRFERPERVHFRLVRGPVPHAVEEFLLRETPDGTELEYSGELGSDLWLAGELWGAAVARTWEATVRGSLESVRSEAERRSGRQRSGV
jgi:Polyketide cyclase / dehydrase and lipid transport